MYAMEARSACSRDACGCTPATCLVWNSGSTFRTSSAKTASPQIPMSLRAATVYENAQSPLDCGASTPPWNSLKEEDEGGVESVK